MNQVHVRKFL